MMTAVLCFVRENAKAIAGFAATAAVGFLARFVTLGPEVEIGLGSVIVAAIVWVTRNTRCS